MYTQIKIEHQIAQDNQVYYQTVIRGAIQSIKLFLFNILMIFIYVKQAYH